MTRERGEKASETAIWEGGEKPQREPGVGQELMANRGRERRHLGHFLPCGPGRFALGCPRRAKGLRASCAPRRARGSFLGRPGGFPLLLRHPPLPLPGKRQNWLCSRKWKRHAGLSAAAGEPPWGSASPELAAEPWQCRRAARCLSREKPGGLCVRPRKNNSGETRCDC